MMNADSSAGRPLLVLIVGGGVAGLEAALALHDLAGQRVSLTLLDPADEFVYRPMTVREPFAFGAATRYPLDEVAAEAGAALRHGALESVDMAEGAVRTSAGDEISYDALMLGVGAEARPRYEHAVTVDDKRIDEQLHGLIQDVEEGYVKRLAFVAPTPMAWPLPLYELALMTAGRAYEMNVELEVTVLTPEEAPLAIFGEGASRAVADLLAERGIGVISSAHCEIPSAGVIEIMPGLRRLEVDRIVALPELHGRAIPGLPSDRDGFIPVDEHCKVRGAERVYAAGDATDFPVKFGGIAAQQADTAATAIAAIASAPVQPEPFEPIVQGMLLTGGEPRYFSAYLTGGHGWGSEVSRSPLGEHRSKIAAKYLAPYLEHRGRAA
jgi:sulfide:quinone oxidoreductase